MKNFSNFRINQDVLLDVNKVLGSEVSMFEFRPITAAGKIQYKKSAMKDIKARELKFVLDSHNVSLIATIRRNKVKEALSWYRARVIGKGQFKQNGPDYFDLRVLQKWLDFVLDAEAQILNLLKYYQRPNIIISYEDFQNNPKIVLKQILSFLKVDETVVEYNNTFRKLPEPDELRQLVQNWDEFCDYFTGGKYEEFIQDQNCSISPQSKENIFQQKQQKITPSDLTHWIIQGEFCNEVDMKLNNISSQSQCLTSLAQTQTASQKRIINKQGLLFYKHVHKAGGTSLCSIAKQNMLTDENRLPNRPNWGTNCIPITAFTSPHPHSKIFNLIKQKQQQQQGGFIPEQYKWGGAACWYQFLDVEQQMQIQNLKKKKGLEFIASEGALPDEYLLLGGGMGKVIMLRDPLDRTLSSYHWWKFMQKQFPKSPALCRSYNAPANSSLFEWLHIYPDNWMVRTLNGKNYLMNHEQLQLNKSHLLKAKQRLLSFNAVLIMEKFNQSINLMAELFNWKNNYQTMQNVRRRSKAVHELTHSAQNEELNLIISKNQLDEELYKFAGRLFNLQLVQKQSVANSIKKLQIQLAA